MAPLSMEPLTLIRILNAQVIVILKSHVKNTNDNKNLGQVHTCWTQGISSYNSFPLSFSKMENTFPPRKYLNHAYDLLVFFEYSPFIYKMQRL